MKDLNKYINESLFDIDNSIDNLELTKWVIRFENTSNLQKTIEEFIDEAIKNGAYQTTAPKLKGDEIFIRYVFDNPGDTYESLIDFYWPHSHKIWCQFHIIKKGQGDKKIKFNNWSDALISRTRYCDFVIDKKVIVLPKQYIKLIELLCERYK
jgi:hypothetical protein